MFALLHIVWSKLFANCEWCRFEESEVNYKKFLDLKPGTSSAEKDLSQLLQAQSALDSAYSLFESNEYSKALDYIDKVVLVFSPGCLEVFIQINLLLKVFGKRNFLYLSCINWASYF